MSADQSKYTAKLAHTNILITGGTSGLGFALAEALLEQSPPPSNIIIVSSNPQRVQKAIHRLTTSYPTATQTTKVTGLTCDFSDEDNLESNITTLFSQLPLDANEKLNHVIHTAGDALSITPLANADLAFIKRAGMVRFFAPLLLAKHAAAHLPPTTGSSITITGGGIASKPNVNWTVVGAYATGLQGMMRGLALDLKPIRVNLVQPGAVDTELWDAYSERGSEARAKMQSGIAAKMCTGRVGRVEDVVEGFLMCMKDGNLTGSMIDSNGGGLLM